MSLAIAWHCSAFACRDGDVDATTGPALHVHLARHLHGRCARLPNASCLRAAQSTRVLKRHSRCEWAAKCIDVSDAERRHVAFAAVAERGAFQCARVLSCTCSEHLPFHGRAANGIGKKWEITQFAFLRQLFLSCAPCSLARRLPPFHYLTFMTRSEPWPATALPRLASQCNAWQRIAQCAPFD